MMAFFIYLQSYNGKEGVLPSNERVFFFIIVEGWYTSLASLLLNSLRNLVTLMSF